MSFAHLRPCNILLIGGHPNDEEMIREKLKESSLNINLSVAHDRFEAIKYLEESSFLTNKNLPDLILLDNHILHLEKDFLQSIKAQKRFRDLPIIVVTSSSLNQQNSVNKVDQEKKIIALREFAQSLKLIEHFFGQFAPCSKGEL